MSVTCIERANKAHDTSRVASEMHKIGVPMSDSLLLVLPKDVMHEILLLLKNKEVRSLSQTCKRALYAVDDVRYWPMCSSVQGLHAFNMTPRLRHIQTQMLIKTQLDDSRQNEPWFVEFGKDNYALYDNSKPLKVFKEDVDSFMQYNASPCALWRNDKLCAFRGIASHEAFLSSMSMRQMSDHPITSAVVVLMRCGNRYQCASKIESKVTVREWVEGLSNDDILEMIKAFFGNTAIDLTICAVRRGKPLFAVRINELRLVHLPLVIYEAESAPVVLGSNGGSYVDPDLYKSACLYFKNTLSFINEADLRTEHHLFVNVMENFAKFHRSIREFQQSLIKS